MCESSSAVEASHDFGCTERQDNISLLQHSPQKDSAFDKNVSAVHQITSSQVCKKKLIFPIYFNRIQENLISGANGESDSNYSFKKV